MKRTFFISMIILLLIFIISCGEEEENNEKTVIDVTENISSPTTWTGDNVYVIKKYNFYVDAALTIMPGAIVKFSDQGANIKIGQGGSIDANGESGNAVVFTDYADDSKGGDTNDDGSSSASSGSWGMIDVNGQTADFNYCGFYYGGNSANKITLNYPSGSKGSVKNCKFKNNKGGPGTQEEYYYGVLNAEGADPGIIISGNSFENNDLPLAINADVSIDKSNSFSGNKYQGIFVSGTVNDITNWGEDEVAFVYTGTNFQIQSGCKLNMDPGVVIKFMSGDMSLLDGVDNLSDNYSNGSEVKYTSFKHDINGDSNGDGNLSDPSEGDWDGIYKYRSRDYYSWDNILYDSKSPV